MYPCVVGTVEEETQKPTAHGALRNRQYSKKLHAEYGRNIIKSHTKYCNLLYISAIERPFQVKGILKHMRLGSLETSELRKNFLKDKYVKRGSLQENIKMR